LRANAIIITFENNQIVCLFVFSLFVFFLCDDARKNMCESNYPIQELKTQETNNADPLFVKI